jgi:hypothetical protein
MRNSDDEKLNEKWPVLSDIAMPGIVGNFVSLATRKSEADPAAVLATFLVRFGVEIGSNPYLMIGDTKHNARLFAAIVGATSKARKGTSARPVDRLFSNISDKFVNSSNSFDINGSLYTPAKTSPGPLSSGEGLLWQVSDQNTGADIQKRLFILDEELAAALKSTERHGNTLSTTIRKLWDTGDIEPLTKNDRIKVTSAHVGIVTHITIEELKGSLKAIELHNGLANRFLWICSKRSKLIPNPTPMPTGELAAIQSLIINIIQRISGATKMEMTNTASDLWDNLYPEISKDHPGLIGSVINRAEAQIMRLAITYALIDNKYNIDTPHLKAALAFWEYAEASDESSPFEKIVTSLRSGEKTKTELHQTFGNNMAAEIMNNTLQKLKDLNLVDCRQEKSSGPKPKTIYSLRINEFTNLSNERGNVAYQLQTNSTE